MSESKERRIGGARFPSKVGAGVLVFALATAGLGCSTSNGSGTGGAGGAAIGGMTGSAGGAGGATGGATATTLGQGGASGQTAPVCAAAGGASGAGGAGGAAGSTGSPGPTCLATAPITSGVPATTRIDALTPAQQAAICDWVAGLYGGYGQQVDCGDGSVLIGPPDQGYCVAGLTTTSCAATVADKEACERDATCANQGLPDSCDPLLLCQ